MELFSVAVVILLWVGALWLYNRAKDRHAELRAKATALALIVVLYNEDGAVLRPRGSVRFRDLLTLVDHIAHDPPGGTEALELLRDSFPVSQ